MNKSIIISKSGGVELRSYENSDLPIDYYFDTTKRKGAIFLVNKHSDLEMLFVTNGTVEIHLDNEVFVGDVGDIIVINPNVLHNIILYRFFKKAKSLSSFFHTGVVSATLAEHLPIAFAFVSKSIVA